VLAEYFTSKIASVEDSERADDTRARLRKMHDHLTESSPTAMTLGQMATIFGAQLMEQPPITENNEFTFDPI